MNERLLLDAGPLGRLCRPNARSPVNREISLWFRDRLREGTEVVVPEIADYEVRRELLRAGLTQSLQRLDRLKRDLAYLALDTSTMLRAAELWAQARNQGLPTADRQELDCDVILAAQAECIGAIVATENVGHLARFVQVRHWREIRPDRENQPFWVASGYCTNERWKTDDPAIRIIDYCVNHTKTCMMACEHKVTLRPGETLTRVVSPSISPQTRTGRRVIRFASVQPNLDLVGNYNPDPRRRYPPRIYWSNPVTVYIPRG